MLTNPVLRPEFTHASAPAHRHRVNRWVWRVVIATLIASALLLASVGRTRAALSATPAAVCEPSPPGLGVGL